MQYLLLIYQPAGTDMPDQEPDPSVLQAYNDFTASIRKSGEFVAGDALDGVSTATTVRVRQGEPLVTDGPFAETHEVLVGYYLVDTETRERAEELAGRIPGARLGSVEVRPVWLYE